MFVGTAGELGSCIIVALWPLAWCSCAVGTGKTTLIKSYLAGLDETTATTVITLNYYMDHAALQARIDGSIDKRSGRTFGPPQGKRMVFYLDDLNLPYVETYGTQNSLSFLRTVMSHKCYYDRADLGFRKEITDCIYVSSMNPTAGNFTVTERLQRLFTTFGSLMPSDSDLAMIYRAILGGHLQSFSAECRNQVDAIVDASIKLHKAVAVEFLPVSLSSYRVLKPLNLSLHYLCRTLSVSLTTGTVRAARAVLRSRMLHPHVLLSPSSVRELANIFQGMCQARADFFPQPIKVLRLWAHETQRVFGDRLVDAGDMAKFDLKIKAVSKLAFKDADQDKLFEGPNSEEPRTAAVF